MKYAVAAGPRATPILFVHGGLDWITGSERCLLDLIAHLDRDRYTPIVWCNAPVLREAAAALGATVYASPEWSAHEPLLPSREHVREARDLVRRHRVGLIHANDSDPLRVLVPAARSARIPLLAHLHLRLTLEERRASWLHQVSLAVGVSEAAVRGLREDGFPARRTMVIYNGVDPQRLAEGDARGLRRELGIGADDVVFTVVGSLIARKGIDVVLRAFRRLRERRSDCWLLVCGDGPLGDELRHLASTEGVGPYTHFLGRRRDVGAVLRDASDVVVSAAWEESFGLNLVEAAVLGRPAVASAIDAHVEILAAGSAGLLFPTGDAEALAGAMESMVADPVRRRQYGAVARERATRSFLVTRYADEFEAAYQRLLARPRAAYGWRGSWSWPEAYTAWAAQTLERRLVRRGRRP